MSTKKVYIEMDEMWVWYTPGEAGCYTPPDHDAIPKTVKLSKKWLRELEKTRERYFMAQRVLEHLYRAQEGLILHSLTDEEVKELKRAQSNI